MLSSRAGNAAGLYLLTGARGCGKTAWCLELVRQARLAGLRPAGLVSPAVFAGGEKVAIDLEDVAGGERRRLAVKRAGPVPQPGAGTDRLGWRFDRVTLAWGNRILAGLEAVELLILDELGPLEFHCQAGLLAGPDLIDRGAHRLACVVLRPELLAEGLQRWPWGQVLLPAEPPVEVSRV
jgi:nucleoside-triphosphatase THEP1